MADRQKPHYATEGYGKLHEQPLKDGKATARFTAKLPKPGRYEVLVASPPNSNGSSKVAVEVHSTTGKKLVHIDQRKTPPNGKFHSLGIFDFTKTGVATVSISNTDSDGYVVIDAVQWLAKSPNSHGTRTVIYFA